MLVRLLTALAAAAMTVAGSLPDPYTVEDVIKSRCGPAQSCYPSSARIDQLGAEMTGYITRQSSVKYSAENLMYNREQQRTTNMIAMVKTKEDIQKAVLFAREFNLHVTIKSTGHDYAGRSTWEDSFVIHLGHMDNIRVNPNATARSQHGEIKTETGTNWMTIYKLLDGYDRVVVGGSAHTVGPGGYTLGGGHSPVSRSLGYAVDNLLELQVVLADGSLATCTENRTVIDHVNGSSESRDDGDLFWAHRGGGGGTFGVTVYLIFKLHPQPSEMVVFSGLFPLTYQYPALNDDVTYNEVMTSLINFINNSPRHWGGYWFLSAAPIQHLQYRMRGSVYFFMNKFGPYDEDTEKELADFLAIRDKYSLLDIKVERRSSFWDYEQHANDPPSADVYLATSLLGQQGAQRDTFLRFFRKELLGTMRDEPIGCTGILTGGKTTEPAVSSTPLNPGFRSAVSVMSCGLSLETGNRNALINKAKQFGYRLRGMGQGMYLNEPTIDSVYWREDFWGKDNYRRLVAIKQRYDPDNFFTCYRCVNSDTTPYRTTGAGTGSRSAHAHWFGMLLAMVLVKAM